MDDNPHQADKTTRKRRVLRRLGLLVAALAMAGVVVAACGGGSSTPGVASGRSTPSTTASGSSSNGSSYSKDVAYAACIRSHGVPSFPDPSGGAFHSTISPNNPQLRAAEQACASLAPGGGQNQTAGGNFTPSQVAQLLKYSQCMRKHGILNFPDPTSKGMGSLHDVDMNSPQFAAASQACQSLLPTVGGTGPVTRPGS